MKQPTGDILIEGGKHKWTGAPVMRTDYPSLLYALGAEYELPLGPGSKVMVGPFSLVVVEEEPETATALVRRRGLWGWLWWAGWRLLRR